MITYREEIRRLDLLATPSPWASDGELYGVRVGGSLIPLGFAPHRPLDSRLIAIYRSALMSLLDAVDAVESLALRATANQSVPAAIGISQILTILDASDTETESFRETLAELDRRTTPPPWDPGHLVLGMELDARLQSSLGIATPRVGDCELIAVARVRGTARSRLPRARRGERRGAWARRRLAPPRRGSSDCCSCDWIRRTSSQRGEWNRNCLTRVVAVGRPIPR